MRIPDLSLIGVASDITTTFYAIQEHQSAVKGCFLVCIAFTNFLRLSCLSYIYTHIFGELPPYTIICIRVLNR